MIIIGYIHIIFIIEFQWQILKAKKWNKISYQAHFVCQYAMCVCVYNDGHYNDDDDDDNRVNEWKLLLWSINKYI